METDVQSSHGLDKIKMEYVGKLMRTILDDFSTDDEQNLIRMLIRNDDEKQFGSIGERTPDTMQHFLMRSLRDGGIKRNSNGLNLRLRKDASMNAFDMLEEMKAFIEAINEIDEIQGLNIELYKGTLRQYLNFIYNNAINNNTCKHIFIPM